MLDDATAKKLGRAQMIAAQQTGRKAFLMELDPLDAEVIVQRVEIFSGTKAERC